MPATRPPPTDARAEILLDAACELLSLLELKEQRNYSVHHRFSLTLTQRLHEMAGIDRESRLHFRAMPLTHLAFIQAHCALC
jgi:hypothetical protein